MANATPIVNLPFLYINNLQVTNNATTPNTKLDVAAGQCRDSTNVFDMVLSSSVTINAAANGLNGLDTGSLAASKVYNVFLISDPFNGNATGAILSLSEAPLMPFGYSAYRKIGYAVTDASVHFLLMYVAGNGNLREFMYDAPQATAVTAGNATSYTDIDLSALVPTVDNTPVYVQAIFTPGAAGRTVKLQPKGATGDAVTIYGQVTSVVISGINKVLARVSASKPYVDYKVSNSGDAVAINVAGFEYFV